jgi:uncharacterized protein YndB with AHSA1/START domain
MSWVRRYFLHLLSVIACQFVSIPLAAETTPDISVHVEMRGEVIRVDVDLIIAAPPKEVWEVLTDFEHLPRFISNITSSKIVSRVGNTVRVAQSGKTNFGPLTFDFQSEREITLSPFTRFESRMISGNLKRFNGTTQLESIEGGTKVRFHSESVPETVIPLGLARPLIEAETREHYQEIRNEVLRRRVGGLAK